MKTCKSEFLGSMPFSSIAVPTQGDMFHPRNPREWSWPELLAELKLHNLNISPKQFPFLGDPEPNDGGNVIVIFSRSEVDEIAKEFTLSIEDAQVFLKTIQELDKQC